MESTKYGVVSQTGDFGEEGHTAGAPVVVGQIASAPVVQTGSGGAQLVMTALLAVFAVMLGFVCVELHQVKVGLQNPGPSQSSGESLGTSDQTLLECYAEVDREQQTLFMRPDFMANQGFEIGFHLRNTWRRSSSFLTNSRDMFIEAGLSLTEFQGKIVVDIGAGSRMRGAVLPGAKLVAVEPMGPQLLNYLATHPEQKKGNLSHMDFYKPNVVWQLKAAPAEQRLCSIEGKAELVYSINVIDHAYNWQKIIQNMALAVKHCGGASDTCGRMFITVDLNHRPHEGHPFTLTKEGMEEVYQKNGLRVLKYYTQGSHAAGFATKNGPAVVTGCWVLVRTCCAAPGQ